MESEPKAMATVNVDDGFLPKFTPAFLKQYGRESLFVRTLSDYYTIGLARMYEAHGMLTSPHTVALFSTESAVKLLADWFRSVDGAKQTALQESMGALPVGSLEALVDKTLGIGRFAEWLTWLNENASPNPTSDGIRQPADGSPKPSM